MWLISVASVIAFMESIYYFSRVAIYLYTQSKILAGNNEALKYIEKNAAKYGLRRLTRLPVSGAFHTKLMEPALKSFNKMLNTVQIEEPRCQVYSNYKGYAYGNARLIRRYLPKQIISPVKWEQIMQCVYSRPEGTAFPRTFDVASEGRMKTILKFINLKAHEQCLAIWFTVCVYFLTMQKQYIWQRYNFVHTRHLTGAK